MVYNLYFYPEKGYVKIVTSGHMSVDSIMETLSSVLTHELWEPGMNIYADYTDSSTVELNSERVAEISHIVRGKSEMLGGGKLAIVMSSDLDFGFGRMFQLLTEDHISKEINVYRDPDEASNWIISS